MGDIKSGVGLGVFGPGYLAGSILVTIGPNCHGKNY